MKKAQSEITEDNLKALFLSSAILNRPAKNKPFSDLLDNSLGYLVKELDNAIDSLKKVENDINNWPLVRVDEFFNEIQGFYEVIQTLKDNIKGLSSTKPKFKEIENKLLEYINQFYKVYEKVEAILEEEEKKQEHWMSLKAMWKDWDTEADKHWESL